jgi:hypothetical protein
VPWLFVGLGLLVLVAIAVTVLLTRGDDEGAAPASPTPSISLVDVPDVEGMPRAEAVGILRDVGLAIEVVTGEDGTAPPGTVLRQEPAAGTELEPGEVVRLTVATAPTPVRTPILPPPTVTSDSVRLDWTLGEGGSGVDHFEIFRDGERIGRTDRSVFVDTDVVAGTTYTYGVVAVGVNGTTSRSARHAVLVPTQVTPPTEPGTPTNEPPPDEPAPPEEPSWCDWFPDDPDCQ